MIPQGLSRLRQRLPGILDDADNGLSCAFRDLLQSLAHELSALDASVAEVTQRLARLSRDLEACQRLQEMEGIGPLNATALFKPRITVSVSSVTGLMRAPGV